MKLKNIFSAIVVFSTCLLLSGCKATQKDLDKEIEKMEEITQSGVLFEEDYKISTSMSFEDD